MRSSPLKAGPGLVSMLSLVLALALATALHAQTSGKHPITHEDVWLMPRIGAPVPSPDGRWVTFEVTEPAYDDSAKVEDLWIVPTDRSAPPRRLTTVKGREGDPAWSPDSRRIAFAAKRDGSDVSQVYVLDIVGGGEARRMTDLSGGAWAPQWRPDGSALLVTTSVWRGAEDEAANRRIGEERKAQKYKARTYEGGGRTRYWDRWLEDRTPQLAVVGVDSAAPPRLLFAASRLARGPGYAGRFTEEREVLDADWTPDGSGVVFAASINADRVAYELGRADLFLVAAAGGEPTSFTSGPDTYERPRFSPDGRTLAAIVRVKPPVVYSLDRLVTWPWPDRSSGTIVTAKFDRSVSSWAFTPAGDSLYLTAEAAGHEKLYRLAVDRGEVRPAHALDVGTYTNIAIPERGQTTSLFARWESAVSPAEIYRVQSDGHRTPITTITRARAEKVEWQPVREFTFRSRHGHSIHNLLVLPPGFDSTQSYPLFVVMHGGPHSMWRDQFFVRWNYHLLSAPGYIVLLTNYTGSSGFGEAFARAIEGDPLATPGDDINQAADEALRRFPFVDGKRQCAGGGSYGGYLANWLAATTTRYRCLINHAGLVNTESNWATGDISYPREVRLGGPPWEGGRLWREQNPIRRAARFRTPMLVSVGEKDQRVPINNSLETWTVLQRLKIPSRLLVFPDENHWILKGENSRFFYTEVHAWLAKYLGSSPTPQTAREALQSK